MFHTTLRVQLSSGSVLEYPALVAEYGDWRAAGLPVVGLSDLYVEAARIVAANPWVKGVMGWVHLDESGLAYRVEITGRTTHVVLGAAPMTDAACRAPWGTHQG